MAMGVDGGYKNRLEVRYLYYSTLRTYSLEKETRKITFGADLVGNEKLFSEWRKVPLSHLLHANPPRKYSTDTQFSKIITANWQSRRK